MRVLKFIRPFFHENRGKVYLYAFLSLLLWTLSLVTPFSVGSYIDNLLLYRSADIIWNTVSILALFWTLQLIISYSKNILYTKLQSHICSQITIKVLDHLIRLPLRFFTTNSPAYLNQRISADAQTLTAFAISDILSLIEIGFSYVVVGIILYSLDSLILWMLCALIPVYLLIHLSFKSVLYEARHRYTEASAVYYAATEKILVYAKSVKIHEWQNKLFSLIDSSFSSLHKASVRNTKIGYLLNNTDAIIRYFANIGIYIYAGYRILGNNMSIGHFTMITSYASMLIAYIGAVLRVGKNYRNVSVSYDRIMQLLNEPQEHCGEDCLREIRTIEAKNMQFDYGSHNIIDNLSFKLQRGKIYMIVGENGSGKSTLVNILCGLEQDYTGEIYIDGVDLKKINHHHLRKRLLSVVEQEPPLFLKDLDDNVIKDKKKESVESRLMSPLNISDFIKAFLNICDGYAFGESNHLSGGEKQKYAIVCALTKNTDVLIMDEPSSALDKESINQLCKILERLKTDKIIIVVSHCHQLTEIGDEIISL